MEMREVRGRLPRSRQLTAGFWVKTQEKTERAQPQMLAWGRHPGTSEAPSDLKRMATERH